MRPAALLAAAMALASGPASAAEPGGAYLWTRAQVGAGGWHAGLIGDVRMQARTPLWHSDSFLLDGSYAGAGFRAAITPAFAEVGPRLSLAPAAFFDVDVQGSVHRYFGGGIGLLPFDRTSGKLETDRSARADEGFPDTAWTLSVSPTLKAKVGPIVAFDSVAIEAWHIERPAGSSDAGGSPFVYEPFRDLVVAWDDLVIEHQPAVLWMPWKGEDQARLLWVGGTMRDRYAIHSGDHSLTAGPMVIFRPGSRSAAVPTLVLQVLPYIVDGDRVGGVPNIQGALAWKAESPFKAAREPAPR